jgi:hypothetical protein
MTIRKSVEKALPDPTASVGHVIPEPLEHKESRQKSGGQSLKDDAAGHWVEVGVRRPWEYERDDQQTR